MASSSSQLPSSLKGISSVTPSPPSSSLTPVIKDWAKLPSDLTSSILQRLGSIDILEKAQKVCQSWRGVCKDPALWRKIDMHYLGDLENFDEIMCRLEIMCRQAVDRSRGGLVEIGIWDFATDSLLSYIADRSSRLTSFKLVTCGQITNEGLTKSVAKLPFLKELELSYCSLSADSLKVVGQSLPSLKTFKLNRIKFRHLRFESNDDALAISETMSGLRDLQLIGNDLTDEGLTALLDHCPNLEQLDLRQCFNLKIVGDLQKRCSERIKVLRGPNDSTDDYTHVEILRLHTLTCEMISME